MDLFKKMIILLLSIVISTDRLSAMVFGDRQLLSLHTPLLECFVVNAIPPRTVAANRSMFQTSPIAFSTWKLFKENLFQTEPWLVHSPGLTTETLQRHDVIKKMTRYLGSTNAQARELLFVEIQQIFLDIVPEEELILFEPFREVALSALKARWNPSLGKTVSAVLLLNMLQKDLEQEIDKNQSLLIQAHSSTLDDKGQLVGQDEKGWADVVEALIRFHRVAIFGGLEDLLFTYFRVAVATDALAAEREATDAFDQAIQQIHRVFNNEYLLHWKEYAERWIADHVTLQKPVAIVRRSHKQPPRPQANFAEQAAPLLQEAWEAGMDLSETAIRHDFHRFVSANDGTQNGWINGGPLAVRLCTLFRGFAVGPYRGYRPKYSPWNTLLLAAGIEPSQVESRGKYSPFRGGSYLSENETQQPLLEIIDSGHFHYEMGLPRGNARFQVDPLVYATLIRNEFKITYKDLPTTVQKVLSSETLFHQLDALNDTNDLTISSYNRRHTIRVENQGGESLDHKFHEDAVVEAIRVREAPEWLRAGLAASALTAAEFIPRVMGINRWLKSRGYSLQERKDLFTSYVDVLASPHFQSQLEIVFKRYGRQSLFYSNVPSLVLILKKARNEGNSFSLIEALETEHTIAEHERNTESILKKMALRFRILGIDAENSICNAFQKIISPAVYSMMPRAACFTAMDLISDSLPITSSMVSHATLFLKNLADALPQTKGEITALPDIVASAKRLFPALSAEIYHSVLPPMPAKTPALLKSREKEGQQDQMRMATLVRDFLRARSGTFFTYDQIARQLHVKREDQFSLAIQQLLQPDSGEYIYPRAGWFESRPALRYHSPLSPVKSFEADADLAHAVYGDQFSTIYSNFKNAYSTLPPDEALSQLNDVLFEDVQELLAYLKDQKEPLYIETLFHVANGQLLRINQPEQAKRALDWMVERGYFILRTPGGRWVLSDFAKKHMKTEFLTAEDEQSLRNLTGNESLKAIALRLRYLATKNGIPLYTLAVPDLTVPISDLLSSWQEAPYRPLSDLRNFKRIDAEKNITTLAAYLGISSNVIRWGCSDSPRESLNDMDRTYVHFLQNAGPEDLMTVFGSDWKALRELQQTRDTPINSWNTLRLDLGDRVDPLFVDRVKQTFSDTPLDQLQITPERSRLAALNAIDHTIPDRLAFWLRKAAHKTFSPSLSSLYAHHILSRKSPLTVELLAEILSTISPKSIAKLMKYLYDEVIDVSVPKDDHLSWVLEEVDSGHSATVQELIENGLRKSLGREAIWHMLDTLHSAGDITLSENVPGLGLAINPSKDFWFRREAALAFANDADPIDLYRAEILDKISYFSLKKGRPYQSWNDLHDRLPYAADILTSVTINHLDATPHRLKNLAWFFYISILPERGFISLGLSSDVYEPLLNHLIKSNPEDTASLFMILHALNPMVALDFVYFLYDNSDPAPPERRWLKNARLRSAA